MPIQVEALDHITLSVVDLAQARRFYGELLGLPEIERPDNYPFPGAWFRAGTVIIQLFVQTQPEPPSMRQFGLWVSDVFEAGRLLLAAGHQVAWVPFKIPGLARFQTIDPAGNRIELRGADGASFNV